MSSVWVLADDRMGNVNQLLGIAEALNMPFLRKDIRYTRWVRLPNLVRGASLVGITRETGDKLMAPWPDVVLSAGRRSFPVARWIKKQSGGKTKIVQLMNPGRAGFKQADLIVLPVHDNYKGYSKNVMHVSGAPHRITSRRLQDERQVWSDTLGRFLSPRLSLIVGGATKDKPFTEKMALQLLNGVMALQPVSILVTTSRRTPPEVITILKEKLPKECFFYEFGNPAPNPYFGLLSYADMVVVTGDSISMCSECCASGVPVFIFAPDGMVSEKHKRFHQELYAKGYARPLGTLSTVPNTGKIFNPAVEIAQKINAMLQK